MAVVRLGGRGSYRAFAVLFLGGSLVLPVNTSPMRKQGALVFSLACASGLYLSTVELDRFAGLELDACVYLGEV